MCHLRRRRIHVSYEEEEDTCVCTQGTKHSHQRYPPPQTCVAYEEEDTSSYLKHMYPPPQTCVAYEEGDTSSYLKHMYPPPQTCVAYEEEDTSSYLKHMYPPPHMPHPSVGNMHKYDAHHHI
jgi:L,D-peptidoglycan transpeptidase YkuD (ErfK/YbiS/YcfS/YnhG family)